MSEPTPTYYKKMLGGVKADPYRICKLYGINGGPHEHITKKMLRGVNKDDGINTELDLIRVVRGQLDRWEEMIKEDQISAPKFSLHFPGCSCELCFE
ncbi:MAG: hypothetical protein COB12_12010 [Flavobacterium sp.]|nr:MAG: hypothetical protein COB12_12010 [Flavobacterium sp.]